MDTPPTGLPPAEYPRPNLAGDKQQLRAIATAQRQVIYAILGQFIFTAVWIAAGSLQSIPLLLLALVLAVAVLVTTLGSVYRLGNAVGCMGLLCAILMFVPCISIIILLLLSDRATKQLKAAGIKVGFMGADPNSI